MMADNVKPMTDIQQLPEGLAIPEGQLPSLAPGLWPVTPHATSAGINSMADAAARLFSLAGKLAQLKSCADPAALQKELVAELCLFQEAGKPLYSPEQIFVGRYALCATLDDIISHTPWGSLGQWEPYSLLALFSQEPIREEGFFLILERLVRDPAVYIDLMEFMYLCLSLGFRGTTGTTGFTHSRLEQIRDALYRHIRAHKGETCRTLAPYPVRAASLSCATNQPGKFPVGPVLLGSATAILLLVAGFGYWLNTASTEVHHLLARIETTSPAFSPPQQEAFNA